VDAAQGQLAHDLDDLARLDPRPDVRLVVTDLDGTLLDDAKQVHDAFWPLVDELHARGVTFAPASGRQYWSLRSTFAEVAHEMAFIAENGTYVVHDDVELSSDCLPLDAAQGLVRAVRDIPRAEAVLCGKRSAYIEHTDPAFRAEVDPYYARLQVVDDLTAVVDDDVLKVAVYDFTWAEGNAGPALSDAAPDLQVVISGAHWVDVMSPTANKGEAVRQVQRHLGVGADQTMAFGDFLNDLELMDAATYSFAMANAHPQLKERARWIAPANTANGVVRTIRAVLGLPE
jgi:hypothetical protein